MTKFFIYKDTKENMDKLTKDQQKAVRDILTNRSCSYCKYLVSHISWWCGNENAINARGTRIPGVIHCPYFKVDKDYVRKELNIKKRNIMNKLKIAKVLNAVVCLILTVLLMREVYFTWSMYGPYTIMSFIASLTVHGGMGLMVYLGINSLLKKILK